MPSRLENRRGVYLITPDLDDTRRLLVLSPAGLPSGTLERPELAERVLEKLGVRLPQAILEAAQRHGCDLIVMASHGRRGLAGLLLGSETQHVLTHGKIPVLVLR